MLTVKILHDYDVEMDDLGWKLRSFNTRHRNFVHPDDIGLNYNTLYVSDSDLREKFDKGLAFFVSYYEHGNCLWFLANSDTPAGVEFKWDGRKIAGYIEFIDDENYVPDDIKESAESFLKMYTDYCNGNTYAYAIYDGDEVVDCCGGFIGEEHLISYLAEMIGDRDFEVIGEYEFFQGEIEDEIALLNSEKK